MKTVNNCPLAVLGIVLLCFFVGANSEKDCATNKRLSTSKLVCYYSNLDDIDGCYCTHVILPANSDVKGIERAKERAKGVKVYVSVNEFNQGLINLLKSSKVDGLELNLRKLDSKNDIADFISTVKTKIGSDLDIALSVPAKADLVAKYFDFKALSKYADLFILQTAFLGASTNVTFHPSRLSGMWDMQNTDSVVDLVNGLGAPLSKLVIAAPVQAFQFTLQNEEYTAPGSPALELQSITRTELCKLMHAAHKNWTLERDEDQAGPYIFSKNQWIAFEDSKSMDIKTKYSRVRGLAGIALKDLAQDGGSDCGSTILEAAYNGLSRQARAPRGAVLHSLEREIADSSAKTLDSVQLSPYRISRIIDTEGKIHIARQDSRTEFQCSRQGYFVHPRSCNRFYRCVKFDQHSDDYNVFEFDCPAGLAFDERVEVCVWPGSLPHGTPCSGSSEIAPVPRTRFVCPSEPGYYADPENCRWFFACLDHGKSPLSAYEFRCPFGLVFDGDRMVCEWSWLVPKCASSGLGGGQDSGYYYGVGGGNNNGLGEGSLQNYDGLGTLGAIKLGGVAGKLEKPIATVYSNVGDGTLGLGYQNSGGYIEGGSLSYKASQALQNAGLLKVNNGNQGIVYTYTGQAVDENGYLLHPDQANGGAYLMHSGQYQADGGKGAISTQSFTQYTGAGEHSAYGQYYAATDGHHLEQNNLDASDKGASFIQYHGQYGTNQGSGGGESSGYANLAGGAISNQVFTQGQAKHIEHFGSGIAGSINIIGGGFSAVGPVSEGARLHIANHVESGNDDVPGLVLTGTKIASVPIATVVPVPGIKTVAGFETIRGGVIANLPELQYKVKSLEDAGLLLNNFSTSFANFVRGEASKGFEGNTVSVSTARPFDGQPEVYVSSTIKPLNQEHDKPSVSFQESHIQTYDTKGGYNNLQGVSVDTYSTISTPKPAVIVEQQPHAENPAIISKFTIRKPVQSGGYYHVNSDNEIPTVQLKQKTVIEDYTYQQPAVVSQYYYQQPAVKKELYQQPESLSTYTYQKQPVSTYTYQNVAAQATGVGYKQHEVGGTSYQYINLQNQQGGHAYSKSSVVLEEKPQVAVVDNYQYSTPQEGFKETPVVTYSTPKPIETSAPAVATSYFNIDTPNPKPNTPVSVSGAVANSYFNFAGSKTNSQQQSGGYVEETLQSVEVQPPQPAVVSSYFIGGDKSNLELDEQQQRVGYTYPKPSAAFEEAPRQPAVVTSYHSTPKPDAVQEVKLNSYFNFASSKANSEQQSGGYVYHKPETPAVYSTPQSVEVQPPQPAVVSSYFNIGSDKTNSEIEEQERVGGYTYQKPSVAFEEVPRQPAVVTSYNSTPKPEVVQEVKYSTPKPAAVNSYFNFASSKANSEQQSNVDTAVIYSTPQSVEVQPPQPAVASSYFNIGGGKTNSEIDEQQQRVSYTYPKPSVAFEEAPRQPAVVTSYYSTPKPDAVQPAVVNSYFNFASSKANSEQHSGGYVYQQPETPVIYSTPQSVEVQPPQPAVASSYFNIGGGKTNVEIEKQQQRVGYTYPKPSVAFEESPRQPAVVTSYYSTPKPDVVQEVTQKPAVVSSYFNIGGDKTNSEIEEQQRVGYTYQKPSVAFEESPVPPKPVEYTYPQPEVKYSTSKPAVVSSYSYIASTTPKPVAVEENAGYAYPKPEIRFEQLETTPKPALVTSYFQQQPSRGYEYPKPSIQFEDRPQPVQEVPFVKKTAYVTGQYQHQNSQEENYNYQQTGGGKIVVETVQLETTPKPALVSSYFHQQPSKGYEYSKPSIQFEEAAYVTGQHQQQNFEENYNYQHDYQHTGGKVVVENYQYPAYETVNQAVFGEKIYQSTPRPTFVSTIKTIAKKKLQPVTESYISSTIAPDSSTSRPISRYSFSSLDDQYQYNSIVKSRTDEPVRAYLPATSTVRITSALPVTKTKVVEEYVAPEVTTPSQVYLPTKQYLPSRRVKVTTEAPEITTLSREYLPARTRVKITTTGSPVEEKPRRPITVIKQNDAHPLLSAKLGAQCTCVSNTLKLRKKQKIIIVDDDDDDDGYVVDEPEKVIDITPTPLSVDDSAPSDKEIAKAVRTGLKLVKQAAKDGAKEGTQEVLSKQQQFDRYGPGGVRSRSESLQGTIDCQRAGLFRHPTECNKFYACRWDCTKKRFTLHVFNCPVHLTFDNTLGACNWPSQGPACVENTLITSD